MANEKNVSEQELINQAVNLLATSLESAIFDLKRRAYISADIAGYEESLKTWTGAYKAWTQKGSPDGE